MAILRLARIVVHFACLQQWPLASQIGCGASKTLWPCGKPTNSGGRKERRDAGKGKVAMLYPKEITKIKAGIKVLEKARDESRDKPTREVIESWIEEQKQRLDSGKKSK
jgi:hypothetical protein